jgi:hypothetical protein
MAEDELGPTARRCPNKEGRLRGKLLGDALHCSVEKLPHRMKFLHSLQWFYIVRLLCAYLSC